GYSGKTLAISARNERSQSGDEHPADASSSPLRSTNLRRFCRSESGSSKAPSPVMITSGNSNSSGEESLTAWKRRLVEMADAFSASARKWSEKHLLLLVPA